MSVIPLELWRDLIGYNPWHFWGLAGQYVPVTSACNSVVKKYAWQSIDCAGRDDIIRAIEKAERKLFTQLNYYVAPRFVTKTITLPKYTDRKVWQLGYSDPSYRWRRVKLNDGYVNAVGVETRTSIGTVTRTSPPDPGDTLVFSDDDGDSLYENWTATISTTVTDPSQIAVYFPSSERLMGDSVSEKWRIAKVSVSISGGVATIRGKVWQLVRPILYEGVSTNPLNADDLTNYVTSLEVYRYYCDPTGTTVDTSQAKLIWETEPYPGWASCCPSIDNSRDPAALAYAMARVGIGNAKRGEVYIGEATYSSVNGTWCSTDWTTCRPPERIEIRYHAGHPLQDYQIDSRMADVTMKLAAAELNRKICACDSANRELYRWQFDLSRTGANDEFYSPQDGDMQNPFGYRRGHVAAWREVRQLRNLTGFTVV